MKRSFFRSARGQGVVDQLVAYGWVILVLGLLVTLLFLLGVFNPVPCPKNRFGFSAVVPVDWALYSGSESLVFRLTNEGGSSVKITKIGVTLDEVVCSSSFDVILESGQSGIFTVDCSGRLYRKYNVGACYSGDTVIEYLDVDSGVRFKSRGKISSAAE